MQQTPGVLDGIIRIQASNGEAVDIAVHAELFVPSPTPYFVDLTPDDSVSAINEPVDLSLTVGDGDGWEDISSIRFVIKEGIGTSTTSDALIFEFRSSRPDRVYMHHPIDGWIWAIMGGLQPP